MNVALLMKQLWRICKHPNLILSKVLRAKFSIEVAYLTLCKRRQILMDGNSYVMFCLFSNVTLRETG